MCGSLGLIGTQLDWEFKRMKFQWFSDRTTSQSVLITNIIPRYTDMCKVLTESYQTRAVLTIQKHAEVEPSLTGIIEYGSQCAQTQRLEKVSDLIRSLLVNILRDETYDNTIEADLGSKNPILPCVVIQLVNVFKFKKSLHSKMFELYQIIFLFKFEL